MVKILILLILFGIFSMTTILAVEAATACIQAAEKNLSPNAKEGYSVENTTTNNTITKTICSASGYI